MKKVKCGYAVINGIGSVLALNPSQTEAYFLSMMANNWAGSHPPHCVVEIFYEAEEAKPPSVNSESITH